MVVRSAIWVGNRKQEPRMDCFVINKGLIAPCLNKYPIVKI